MFDCLSVYLIYCSFLLNLMYHIGWIVIISPPPISLFCLCLFNYCAKGCNHFSSLLFFVWFIIMDVWMFQPIKLHENGLLNQTWTKLLKLKIVWIKIAIRM